MGTYGYNQAKKEQNNVQKCILVIKDKIKNPLHFVGLVMLQKFHCWETT